MIIRSDCERGKLLSEKVDFFKKKIIVFGLVIIAENTVTLASLHSLPYQ
jgi:hypothetical protein